MDKKTENRIFEIDFFRGIALLLMIYFHIVYDLVEFNGFKLKYSSGYIFIIGQISAVIFIVISGVASSLSKNNLIRGLKIFGIGVIITIITHTIGEGLEIYFGILHFLGISMIISHFILKIPSKMQWVILTFLFGLIILMNKYIQGLSLQHNFLLMIGLTTKDFYSADYFPIIPWLGIFLIGFVLGKVLYQNRQSLNPLLDKFQKNPINYIGRNSLLIYLLHQPIIIFLLKLYK